MTNLEFWVKFKTMDKPKLLLHACCGVCSAYVPELLMPEFEVTVYYENSNIYPQEEYFRRREAAQTMAGNFELPFIEAEYNPDAWDKETYGHEDDRERGPRCTLCINFRLDKTFEFAKNHRFGWVATTLSVSRRKSVSQINEIGEALSKLHGLSFLGRDWKKQNGEKISQERAKNAGIYRQDYCGCRYSLKQRLGE